MMGTVAGFWRHFDSLALPYAFIQRETPQAESVLESELSENHPGTRAVCKARRVCSVKGFRVASRLSAGRKLGGTVGNIGLTPFTGVGSFYFLQFLYKTR